MKFTPSLIFASLFFFFAGCSTSTPPGDTIPPTVSLQASSTTVNVAGAIRLTATAQDNKAVSKVEFFEGNTRLGEDATAPYTWDVTYTGAQNGAHTYTAKAFDAGGNSTTSAPVTVTVNIPAIDQGIWIDVLPLEYRHGEMVVRLQGYALQAGLKDYTIIWKFISGVNKPDLVGRAVQVQLPENVTGPVVIKAISGENPALTRTFTLNVKPPVENPDLSLQLLEHDSFQSIFAVVPKSTYQISEITLTHPGTGLTQEVVKRGTYYTLPLDTSLFPRGENRFDLTLKDVKGNIRVYPLQLVMDAMPRLVIKQGAVPFNSVLATNKTVRLQAECVDDGEKCVIFVYQDDNLILQSMNPVDQVIDVSGPTEKLYNFKFAVTDDVGHRPMPQNMPVYFTGPGFTRRLAVPGTIWDLDENQVLYSVHSVPYLKETPSEVNAIHIRSLAEGSETVVDVPDHKVLNSAELYPNGAVYMLSRAPGFFSQEKDRLLYDSKTPLTPLDSQGIRSYAVAGLYLTWLNDSSQRFVRNLTTGETQSLGQKVEGTLTPSGAFLDCICKLDGNMRLSLENATAETVDLVLFDGTQDILIQSYSTPPGTFLLNNGHVAYQLPSGDLTQVWVRTPAGEKIQKTFRSQSSFLVHLSPTGEVVVRTAGKLYRIDTAGNEHLLGSDMHISHVRWLEDRWNLVMYNAVFYPAP